VTAIDEDSSGSLAHGSRQTGEQARGRAAGRAWPLHAYFAVLLVVYVIAAASGSLYVRAQSERDALSRAQHDAAFTAPLVARAMAFNARQLQSTTDQIAATPGILATLSHAASCRLTFVPSAVFTAGHYDVVGADGTVGCTSLGPGEQRPKVGASWLPDALRRPLLLAPVPDPEGSVPGILCASPIPGGGAAVAFVELPPIGGALASLYDAGQLEFLITTADGGTVLVRSIDARRWVGASLGGTPFARATDPVQRPDVDGRQRLYGQSTAAGVSWRVYVGADRTTALATATSLFQRQLVIILAGLAAALATAALVYRGVARPIRQLSGSVRAATARPEWAPVSVDAGPSEVLSLMDDFNVLIASVDHELAERRRAEAAVRSLNQELEARVSARTAELEAANAELEAFSYCVSHDLRAPVRAVAGLARMVVEEHAAELPADAGRLLDQVAASAEQMGQLIDALLALARLGQQGLHPETVELEELVAEVMRELEPAIGARHVELTVGRMAPVWADRTLMRQVIANLLSNAVKFTAGRDPAVIEVGCVTEGAQPVYFVRDNGAGFDERYADKLFQVFQRLHRTEEFDGTGVGLALAERIVRRHGGRIWADGAVGRGATFRFTAGEAPPTSGSG
jgi:signal transduction histidine kinase